MAVWGVGFGVGLAWFCLDSCFSVLDDVVAFHHIYTYMKLRCGSCKGGLDLLGFGLVSVLFFGGFIKKVHFKENAYILAT